MNKKWWFALIAFILLTVIVFFAKFDVNKNDVIEKNTCKSDGDCAPAECCHPTSCVLKEEAPNCKGKLCTLNCEPETLDCGQGSCECINNLCEAVIG